MSKTVRYANIKFWKSSRGSQVRFTLFILLALFAFTAKVVIFMQLPYNHREKCFFPESNDS